MPDAPVLPAPSRFDPKHIHEETTGTSVTQWVECFRNQPVLEDWFYEANVFPMVADVKWVDSLNSLDNSQLFDCKEEDFHTIDRTAAQSLIKRNLMTSLAYRTNVMPEGVAEAWATSFVESFSEEGTQWYGNHDVLESGNLSWNPVTQSTFDVMVVAVDITSNAIGYFLVTDED